MTVALIDADIVAYKAACLHEEGIDWDGDGDLSWYLGDEEHAWKAAEDLVEEHCSSIEATDVIVCFTHQENFRKKIYPQYKSNRKDRRKPAFLDSIKTHLAYRYRTYVRPWLEADDCMGILATTRSDCVMVSEDKDMRTIPGKLYNPNMPRLGVQTISELDADRFLCWQTICGDSTDGFPGCPRVGPKSDYAEEVIFAENLEEAWDLVLLAYGSKGLSEMDAIVQARCARILRKSDYNNRDNRVILWEPPI